MSAGKIVRASLIALCALASGAARTHAAVSYDFTNAGATGRFGPTQAMVNAAYAATPLAGLVTVSDGIQSWTVPTTGLYSLEAAGAQGASAASNYVGGKGAYQYGEYYFNAGTVLQIVVGQMGLHTTGSAGGGGGSFIVDASNTPLLIAGGGGGVGSGATQNGNPGQAGNLGTTASGSSPTGGGTPTGSAGAGGAVSASDYGAGGAGFYADGAADIGLGTGGRSWANGLAGGTRHNPIFVLANGGFGGGGAGNGLSTFGGGGGGGYSGGAGGSVAGGAGSYNSGLNAHSVTGYQSGDGFVTITLLAAAAPPNVVPESSSILAWGTCAALGCLFLRRRNAQVAPNEAR
jgi:hypothetical protein